MLLLIMRVSVMMMTIADFSATDSSAHNNIIIKGNG